MIKSSGAAVAYYEQELEDILSFIFRAFRFARAEWDVDIKLRDNLIQQDLSGLEQQFKQYDSILDIVEKQNIKINKNYYLLRNYYGYYQTFKEVRWVKFK